MRAFWLLFLVILVIMAYTCHSCQESFKSKAGLSKHQKTCVKTKKTRSDGLERRRQRQQEAQSGEENFDLAVGLEETAKAKQFFPSVK